MAPTARRQTAHQLVAHGLSQRRACQVVRLARSSYARGGRATAQAAADAAVTAALQALVARHPGWGFWKYQYRLRKNGVVVKHKRLWRIYQALGLQLGKRRKKRRLPARLKPPLQVPAARLYQRRADRRPAFPDAKRQR